MSYYNLATGLLAERIANTRDTTLAEPEYLRTPDDLARYVRSWNIPLTQEPGEQDLAEVLALRDRLRSVFKARDTAVAAQVLDELLEGVPVTPHARLLGDGAIRLELGVAKDLPLARRLGAAAALGLCAALEQYGIERLHVCSAAPCTEVFVDTSRNHTRRYCCEQCANRHNVAAFRKRQRTG